VRDHQQKFLSGWIGAVAPVLFPQANTFSLDFHPIPFRGLSLPKTLQSGRDQDAFN
jgi:hypothetical protein